MNKSIKSKWLKALRSGKYEQGRHLLKTNDNKYCCLGVLCDLYTKVKKHKTKWIKTVSDGCILDSDRTRECAVLPQEVSDWAGVSKSPYIESLEESLIVLNDNKKFNFKQIADTIEKNL